MIATIANQWSSSIGSSVGPIKPQILFETKNNTSAFFNHSGTKTSRSKTNTKCSQKN